METKLYLVFENLDKDIMRLSLNSPKEDLTEVEVLEQMSRIVEENAFSIKGSDIAGPKAAYKIEQTRTDFIEGE